MAQLLEVLRVLEQTQPLKNPGLEDRQHSRDRKGRNPQLQCGEFVMPDTIIICMQPVFKNLDSIPVVKVTDQYNYTSSVRSFPQSDKPVLL